HDADIVVLEVQRHALDAARELDHLAGLDAIEPVDAGNAVADRQHLADFRDIGLGAEIRDLLLEDCRNFGGADVHQPSPFIASSSFWSFVFNELSTMRLPTRTTMPPNRAGSTRVSTETFEPTAWRRAAVTASCCWAVSACAEVTSAATSPRRRASVARKALI